MLVHKASGGTITLEWCQIMTRIDTKEYILAFIEAPEELSKGDIINVHSMSFSVIDVYDKLHECIQVTRHNNLTPVKPSGTNSLRDMAYEKLKLCGNRNNTLTKEEIAFMKAEWPNVYLQYTLGGVSEIYSENPGSAGMILEDIRLGGKSCTI